MMLIKSYDWTHTSSSRMVSILMTTRRASAYSFRVQLMYEVTTMLITELYDWKRLESYFSLEIEVIFQFIRSKNCEDAKKE